MTLFPLTPEEMSEIEQEIFAEIGARPELAYAAQKTGFILTDANKGLASETDLREWRNAIDEYFYLQENPPTPDPADVALQAVMEEWARLPFILAITIEKNAAPSPRAQSLHERFRFEYTMFCAARTLKTLRAVDALVEHKLGEDSLTLVRSIYENYLHAAFMRQQTKLFYDIQIAQLGVAAGTHEHPVTRKGQPDWRRIIEKSTGRIIEASLTTRRMAAASPFAADVEIQEHLYSLLSRYTHPHLFALQHYVDEGGFTATRRQMLVESTVLAMAVSMFLCSTRCSSWTLGARQ
jgi:hypothetical protein